MRDSLLILCLICSFASNAEEPYKLDLSTSYIEGYKSSVNGNSFDIDSFFEYGLGVSYQVELSEFWKADYNIGLTFSEQGPESQSIYGAYTGVDFEYQNFSEQIKPFLGMQIHKPLTSSNTIENTSKLKKSLGFNFYPAKAAYSISFSVSQSD
ncbi:hypothetical protein [Pseudoalteromonas sp. MTN2-4]|uniref:hypothetical protein n=1 Tax=Pseudoalteromonas sp. MTN2-4 TaxID=3056555 RepID=UPI0036F226AC